MMDPKWLRLAGVLLDLAHNQFSRHICNDFTFPKDWTKKDKQAIVKAMYEDNGDPENYDPDHLSPPDWWLMTFLAAKLKEME